jgi:hypothetical protein
MKYDESLLANAKATCSSHLAAIKMLDRRRWLRQEEEEEEEEEKEEVSSSSSSSSRSTSGGCNTARR